MAPNQSPLKVCSCHRKPVNLLLIQRGANNSTKILDPAYFFPGIKNVGYGVVRYFVHDERQIAVALCKSMFLEYIVGLMLKTSTIQADCGPKQGFFQSQWAFLLSL